MKLTILGSGGCTVIPKPLCQCRICREARKKGIPYARAGPSAFLHDLNLLIDTPAEISLLLNRCSIHKLDYLMFTHLDPDHVEGFRIVEQIALDFRTWKTYPEKQVCLLLPEQLYGPLRGIRSQYGPLLDFYLESGFIGLSTFNDSIHIDDVSITAIPVDRGRQWSFVYVFESSGEKIVYAPCDIKPFPENRPEVHNADYFIVQPGIFETGLKHRFKYQPEHISRKSLYTFEQTLELAGRINSEHVVFVHMEEYWNRSYDDYKALELERGNITFSYDGLQVIA